MISAPDTVRGKQAKQLVSLCIEKLKMFIKSPDQNLRYLGFILYRILMILGRFIMIMNCY